MECPEARSVAAPRLFGTDGVRGRPGEGLLAPIALERLVDATVDCLRRVSTADGVPVAGSGARILVARDTRGSGEEIADILTRRFCLHGFSVHDLGILPTPGAALVASRTSGTALAVVVSASHNPADYNGVKLLAPDGSKVSEAFEQSVTEAYGVAPTPDAHRGPGVLDASCEARDSYIDHLVAAARKPGRLEGKTVFLDTAHGATWEAAPEVFRRLGLRVRTVGDRPDGRNINAACGALYPGLLAQKVREGADFGFCFDGDGDRMIPVTSRGTVLDGDHVLFLAGLEYRRRGQLPRATVVATVMSNVGLEVALRQEGIALHRTDVGDRNVYRVLVRDQHPVGGEQSGHIIFLDAARTGDGILAAVRLLDSLDDSLDLERSAAPLARYPQILRNVEVRERRELADLPSLQETLRKAGSLLGSEGRILLRYSGTEPLLRVMVEGREENLIESLCGEVCDAVRASLGRQAGG